MAKRAFDFVATVIGLFFLSLPIGIVALAVRFSSVGPVLFRQTRVGFGGEDFTLFKFRTMTVRKGSEAGSFDAGDTSRITRVGALLRKSKLDELPQLWNVVRGDMALVGPRPEVRKWVELYPESWAVVHTVKPGITDPAAIIYRDEEKILSSSPDPETCYRDEVLPRKLALYLEYVKTRTFWGDIRIIFQTLLAIVFGPPKR